MNTRSFLDKGTALGDEVFTGFESDMAVGIIQLGNPTPKTAESNDTAKHTVGS